MAEYIYQMIKARKAHGDKVILDDVTMSFYPGAKIGVVGPNGAGKTTFFNVITGLVPADRGRFTLAGRAYRPTEVHKVAVIVDSAADASLRRLRGLSIVTIGELTDLSTVSGGLVPA